jgi:hypothetical protein
MSECSAVLSVGYDLADLLEGAPPVSVFPEALSRDDLDGAAEAIDAGLHHSGYALVVYPAWLGDATLRRLETIRAALGSGRLALHGSALPPLAGGVLANLAAALAAHLTSPGQLVAALADLERELVVVSWLGSLTRLKEPVPSVLLHMASWSPRSAFGVVLAPEPAIVRADRAGASLPLERADGPMRLVLSAQPGADPAWLSAAVAAALGAVPTDLVAATTHGCEWWGTSRLVESVAYPTDLADLAEQLAARHRLRLCGWCSEAIGTPSCPFCRGVDQPVELEAAGDRAVAPSP